MAMISSLIMIVVLGFAFCTICSRMGSFGYAQLDSIIMENFSTGKFSVLDTSNVHTVPSKPPQVIALIYRFRLNGNIKQQTRKERRIFFLTPVLGCLKFYLSPHVSHPQHK